MCNQLFCIDLVYEGNLLGLQFLELKLDLIKNQLDRVKLRAVRSIEDDIEVHSLHKLQLLNSVHRKFFHK